MEHKYRVKLYSNTTSQFEGYYSSKVSWKAVDITEADVMGYKSARAICNHFNGYKALGMRASMELIED